MTDTSKDICVVVKPNEIENIIWDAMTWALQNPGTGNVPEYTARGNSFAEEECRAATRRILAAVDLKPAAQVRKEALEEAVDTARVWSPEETGELELRIAFSGLRETMTDLERAYALGRIDATDAIRALIEKEDTDNDQ